MRPIDLFTEKQLNDARSDQNASRSVVQDSFNLTMLGMAPSQLTQRDMKEMQDILNQDSDSQRDKFAPDLNRLLFTTHAPRNGRHLSHDRRHETEPSFEIGA